MMQWLNLTKCGLFFNIVSPAVHTLRPSVLQRLKSRGLIIIIITNIYIALNTMFLNALQK